MAAPPDTAAKEAYIYLRRGFRASDDGTESIPSGHYKVGATGYADVGKRKTDGSLPVTSHPIAKWRVPAADVYHLERQVHTALAALNIKLDNGREWFTWRKVLRGDHELWDALETHERWLLAIIDGCILVRHEPVGPRQRSPPPQRTAVASHTSERKRAATDRDQLASRMLATWHPPSNHPPEAMTRALAEAISTCETVPPGMKGLPSAKTAKSSRIALYIAAAFKRYTQWDGLEISQLREQHDLKQYLVASKAHERRLFSGGSDCGAGSGSQAIGWVASLTPSVRLVARTEDDRVLVQLLAGGANHVWSVEWSAPAAVVPTLPQVDDTVAWEALARRRGRAGFQETELAGLSLELLKHMVTVIKQKRGDPLIGMHQYSTATVCIRYLCTHFETRRERENRLKRQKLTEAAAK